MLGLPSVDWSPLCMILTFVGSVRVSSRGGWGGKLPPQNLGQLYRKVYKATPISWSFPPPPPPQKWFPLDETLSVNVKIFQIYVCNQDPGHYSWLCASRDSHAVTRSAWLPFLSSLRLCTSFLSSRACNSLGGYKDHVLLCSLMYHYFKRILRQLTQQIYQLHPHQREAQLYITHYPTKISTLQFSGKLFLKCQSEILYAYIYVGGGGNLFNNIYKWFYKLTCMMMISLFCVHDSGLFQLLVIGGHERDYMWLAYDGLEFVRNLYSNWRQNPLHIVLSASYAFCVMCVHILLSQLGCYPPHIVQVCFNTYPGWLYFSVN